MPNAAMSPGRGPAEHEVRNQIVAAAAEHFRLYGYGKTTISDLAKAIGFSKAYIYKFFDSKQAIGELICARCLYQIETDVRTAIDAASRASEKLRRMFRAIAESSLRMRAENRKLHDIAVSAATERWDVACAFESRILAMLQDTLRQGRETEEFECKTPLDEAAMAIFLIMLPYFNPALMQYNRDCPEDAPSRLCNLVLRSLSP